MAEYVTNTRQTTDNERIARVETKLDMVLDILNDIKQVYATKAELTSAIRERNDKIEALTEKVETLSNEIEDSLKRRTVMNTMSTIVIFVTSTTAIIALYELFRKAG